MMNWKITWRVAFTLALLLFGVLDPARSDFVYNITIDTTSLNGTPGYLDLQFDPSGGTGTLSATVQTLASSDTIFGSIASFLGDVTGPGATTPPSGFPLSFTADNTNGPQTNDAFLNVTGFGTTLALSLDITPADANSTASFFLTLYDQNRIPQFPNNNGNGNTPAAVEVDLIANPSGNSPTVFIQPLDSHVTTTPAGVVAPAPPSVVLLGISLASLIGYQFILRKRVREEQQVD
jgi:hypothetical protein